MPKIDTSKIVGFNEMSQEEQLKALLEFEVETQVVENPNEAKYKELLSKANGEASEWKKKYNATLTEQQRLELERQEKDKAIAEKLAFYETQERIAGYTQKLMGIGFTQEEAIKMAESLPQGVNDSFFTMMKDSQDNLKKSLEADTLKKQPTLTKGTEPSGEDVKVDPIAEAFRKGAMGN